MSTLRGLLLRSLVLQYHGRSHNPSARRLGLLAMAEHAALRCGCAECLRMVPRPPAPMSDAEVAMGLR